MDTNRLFIGNIKKCTKHDISGIFKTTGLNGKRITGKPSIDSVIYKENAILVRTYRYGFIDIEEYSSLESRDKEFIDKVMTISPLKEGDLFVDYNSLKQYDKEEYDDKVNIKRIKNI